MILLMQDAKDDIFGPFIGVANFIARLLPKSVTGAGSASGQENPNSEESDGQRTAQSVTAEIDSDFSAYQEGTTRRRQESEGAGSKV